MNTNRKIIVLPIAILILILSAGCAGRGKVKSEPADKAAVIEEIKIMDNAVEIKANGPFAYTIAQSDPFKVIVELPGVSTGTFKDTIRSGAAGITEVNPSQVSSPKAAARLEILLQSPSGVEPVYHADVLTVKVKNIQPRISAANENAKDRKLGKTPAPDVASMPPGTGGKVGMPKATEITEIQNVQVDGDVEVVIKGNGSMEPSVFTLKDKIVLDIPDVTAKATAPSTVISPVEAIRVGEYKDKSRFVIDLKEPKDFDVKPAGDTVIVSIKGTEATEAAKESMRRSENKTIGENKIVAPQKTIVEAHEPAEPQTLVEGKYTGEKISLDFQDADIVPIFRLLTDISGYNVVVDPSVKGKLTMKLINVPWDQALDLILKTFTLGKKVEGNIIRIAPLSVFAKESEEEAKAKEAQIKAEPMETKMYPISYAATPAVEEKHG